MHFFMTVWCLEHVRRCGKALVFKHDEVYLFTGTWLSLLCD